MVDIRRLSDTFAVAPVQLRVEDIPDLKARGFRTIIANRPDEEVPAGLQAADIGKAAGSAGLAFVHAPFVGQPSLEAIEAVTKAAAPTFAYCRSGTRSVTAWALSQAKTHNLSPEQILDAAQSAGYDLTPVKGLLRNLASK